MSEVPRTLPGMNLLPLAARHEVGIALPRHWPTRTDPDRGVVVEARSPVVPPGGFVPTLVLRAGPGAGTLPDGAETEDEDAFDLDGRWWVEYLRFAHRVSGCEVVGERWTWHLDDSRVTLTGSVARVDYEDYCDLFEDVAATVDITPGVNASARGSAPRDGGRW